MSRRVRSAIGFIVVATCALAAGDQWAFIQQTPGEAFPTIHVYSDDATAWDRVGDLEDGITFHVDARGSCPEYWRTQPTSYLRVFNNSGNVASASLDIDTDHRSYGPGHGAGWEKHVFKGNYKPPQMGSSPEAACNAWLAQESQGAANPAQRRKQVLAEGITRTIENAYAAQFYLACKRDDLFGSDPTSHVSAQTPLRAKIVCHGNPAALDVPDPPAHRVKHDDGIYHMDIWANPSSSATFKGFCPKTVHFGGEIEYKVLPGRTVNLKYRYVATSGARVIKSDYFTTTYTATARKNLHGWGLDFPLVTGGPQYQAPSNAGTPDVYGGNVVLEFVGAVPMHANLQPVQFEVTCVKQGTVNPAVAGGADTMATATRPRDTLPSTPDANAPQSRAFATPPATATLVLPKPDLVIRSAVLPAGKEPLFHVVVLNAGPGSSAETQLTIFLPDGTPVRAKVPAIPGKAQKEVMVRLPKPLEGTRPVRLRVDDINRVAETNEGNNEYVITSLPHAARPTR